MSHVSQAQHRGRSGIGLLALGIVLALSTASVASAAQYRVTSHHNATSHHKAKPKKKGKASGKSLGHAAAGAVAVNVAKFCPDYGDAEVKLGTDSDITSDGTLDMSDAGTVHDLQTSFRALVKDTSNTKLRNSLNKALGILKPIAGEREDSNGNVNVSNSQAIALRNTINPLLAELNSINRVACANTGNSGTTKNSGNSGNSGNTGTGNSGNT